MTGKEWSIVVMSLSASCALVFTAVLIGMGLAKLASLEIALAGQIRGSLRSGLKFSCPSTRNWKA